MKNIFFTIVFIFSVFTISSCSSYRVSNQLLHFKKDKVIAFTWVNSSNNQWEIKFSKTDTSTNKQKIRTIAVVYNEPKDLFIKDLDLDIYQINWIENGIKKSKKIDLNMVNNDLQKGDKYRGIDKKTGFPYMGTENGSIVIDLYSDFECHACKLLDEKLIEVVKSFKNVKIIRHEFPLDGGCNKLLVYQKMIGKNFHKFACKAAALTYCDKENYWEIHDKLYKNQDKIGDTLFKKIAKEYNISDKKLAKCFEEQGEIFKKIRYHINDQLKKYKINRTPYYIIDNKEYFGASKTVEELKELIKKAGGR